MAATSLLAPRSSLASNDPHSASQPPFTADNLNYVKRPSAAQPLSQSITEQSDDTGALTPLRAHYLKKSLLQLQFHYELDAITSVSRGTASTLAFLGPPFTPPPKDAPHIDLPFLKYIFRQFVMTFPFFAAAPKDFYPDKLQPFMTSVLSRNLSPSTVFDDKVQEGSEKASRLKLLAKLERNFSVFLGNATKLVEMEELVRLSQKDLNRLEMLAKRRQKKQARLKELFEVNVVGVRTVVDRGRMRSRAHDEFIIRTRRSNFHDVHVARRYGDFRTLANELRKKHPDEIVPTPPTKDRSTTATLITPSLPSRTSTNASQSSNSYRSSLTDEALSSGTRTSKLVREKNRLTLRAYLHSLLGNRVLGNSPVLRSFLLSGPTKLGPEEQEDLRRREEADRVREDGRKRFAQELATRVEMLREAVKNVKDDIVGKDGLTHVFSIVKMTPNVQDLPPNYRAVLEWARVSMASTVFHHYVASDNASESFAGLKRIHGLMPYFLLKSALKISNPIAMIRSVLDLFLAHPFGGHSLLQRMFTSSLSEEVKALEEHIEAVKDKVNDPIMCEKIRQFVYAPKNIQDWFKANAASENLNILVVILRSSEPPTLNRPQMQRVVRAQSAHAVYMRARAALVDSDDDEGPVNDDAWLFEDLKILGQLYSRLRDRQQLIELIFEGTTSDLLKDIITIFYSPLAQVYRAASIADSLGDMQAFVNDLIKTVEQVDELSQVDPYRTVTVFIELIQRHEQSFYNFVHKVHSKGEDLFHSLMRWIELFLTVVREGLGSPISLEFLLPHTGPERAAVMKEVDGVALYHYKLKVLYEDKLRRRFGRVQAGLKDNDADAQDEATHALLEGVVGEISFGELVKGGAIDLAAEETDEESDESSEYESSTEDSEDSTEEDSEDGALESPPRLINARSPMLSQSTPTTPRSSSSRANAANERSSRLRSRSAVNLKGKGVTQPPPLPQMPPNVSKPLPQNTLVGSPTERSRSVPPAPTRKVKKTPEILKPPDLEHIPKLLPLFTEMMRPLLRPRRS